MQHLRCNFIIPTWTRCVVVLGTCITADPRVAVAVQYWHRRTVAGTVAQRTRRVLGECRWHRSCHGGLGGCGSGGSGGTGRRVSGETCSTARSGNRWFRLTIRNVLATTGYSVSIFTSWKRQRIDNQVRNDCHIYHESRHRMKKIDILTHTSIPKNDNSLIIH